MAEKTAIEWADSTWSPWEGCTRVSIAATGGGGCDNCYAERMNRWLHKGENWGSGAPRREFSEKHWQKPLDWNDQAAASGKVRSVFPSICDPFDNEVDEALRGDFFHLVEHTPHLRWLLLTKRIGNAARMLAELGYTEPLPNVWLGATVVNQAEADRDVPKLLAVPACVRFLSIEPMLGPVDISRFMWPVHPRWPARYASPAEAIAHGAEVAYHHQGLISANWAKHLLTWVIAGGESGPHARPAHPDWFRSLRDQCAKAGVPFLFKQWGEWADAFDCRGGVYKAVHWSDGAISARVGKAPAGRLLDGVEHNGFPA